MGIQGSGKTVLSQHIAQHHRTLVYTPHARDWKGVKKVHIITPESLKKPFSAGIEDVMAFFKKSRFDMLIIDEADMIFKTKFDIKRVSNDMIINHRHYGKAIGFITRRPQDIPPKILESCHYLFIFALEGKNAVLHLNDVRKGLGDMAAELDFDAFKFISKQIGKEPILMGPVPFKG